MTSRVYFAQKRRPIKDDWFLTIQEDLKEFGMSEDSVKNLSPLEFKKCLKRNLLRAAFQYLNKLRLGHSKGKNLIYGKLECQQYLLSNELNITEKLLLFKLRTQMTDVRANFSSKYENINCNLCDLQEPQTDWHLLECPKIVQLCSKLNNDNQTEYQDLLENLDSQMRAIKIFEAIFKTKEKIEEV